MLKDIVQLPAFWGFLGAFIYAAPRWVACLAGTRTDNGGSNAVCTLEAVIALVIGAIAASAFGDMVMTVFKLDNSNSACAIIGLLANPVTPKLVEAAPSMLNGFLTSWAGKSLKEDPK